MSDRESRECEAPSCALTEPAATMYRAPDGERLCRAHAPGTLYRCGSGQDPEECAAMRERLVAGTAEPIPACPVHGEWTDRPAPLRPGRPGTRTGYADLGAALGVPPPADEVTP